MTVLIIGLTITPTFAQINNRPIQHTIELAQKQGIPGQRLDNLVQRAREKNIPDEEITAMLQPAVEMASHNLPFDLVIRKSLEGIAKGVQPALIVKVEEKLQSNAVDADQLTDAWLRKPTIQNMVVRTGETQGGGTYRNKVLTTITRVLFQGTPRKELGQLLDDMAQNDVATLMNAKQAPTAIGIFPDMPTSNDHPEISRALIIEAIREHFTTDQIQQLPIAMASGIQLGRPAAEALSNIRSEKMDNGTYTAIVLQELFGGNFRGGPSNGIPPGLENPHARNAHANGNGQNNRGNGRNGRQ
ncbi:MAG TPA: hypothetical protein VKA08_15000 [Balneolales bacterium]|nr:hypothetical protein [Balneolales bacterium]